MFGQIQTSQTGGQQYSDTSRYKVSECFLYKVLLSQKQPTVRLIQTAWVRCMWRLQVRFAAQKISNFTIAAAEIQLYYVADACVIWTSCEWALTDEPLNAFQTESSSCSDIEGLKQNLVSVETRLCKLGDKEKSAKKAIDSLVDRLSIAEKSVKSVGGEFEQKIKTFSKVVDENATQVVGLYSIWSRCH